MTCDLEGRFQTLAGETPGVAGRRISDLQVPLADSERAAVAQAVQMGVWVI
ncbi:MAG: hypothetical protein ACR2Q4_06090 [Geminicoccaceae bacterium]